MGRRKISTDGQETDDQQKVQAILLADSFNTNFRPISFEMPKVLSPLVDTPMIHYTLEFLASNGIEEVYVFCVNKAERLSKCLSTSKWSQQMDIICVTSTNCSSAGDALRELDQMGVIHSDPFVLIYGDVVSNIDLRSVMRAHKEAKKKDSSKIMTMCFAKAGPTSRLRPVLNDLMVGLDRDTRQLVLFNNNLSLKSVSLPVEALKDHAQIELHSDLLDCFIDVCSPEVLVQISDNFDYQDLRAHFISNEVSNVELGNKIMAHIIDPKEYSARVEDFHLYHNVSRDIIRRWAYPFVPDNLSISSSDPLLPSRGYIYRDRHIRVPRSVHIGTGTVIGQGVHIDEDAVLEGCVLGSGVSIGAGAFIKDSYLWEGVKVGPRARIEGAVLAQGVIVGSKAVIPNGCVLGEGVRVGDNISLPPFSRFTCVPVAAEDEEWGDGLGSSDDKGPGNFNESVENIPAVGLLGADGLGRIWTESGEEIEDGGWELGGMGSVGIDHMRCRSIGCSVEKMWRDKRWSSFDIEEYNGSVSDIGDGHSMEDFQPWSSKSLEINFNKVIHDMLFTGSSEGHSIDNLLLEIKGYKFAQNRSFAECISACTEALLDLSGCNALNCAEGMPLVASIQAQLQKWHSLLSNLAQNTSDQVEVIHAIEKYAQRPTSNGVVKPPTETPLGAIFRFILQLLYNMEIVSESGMKEWIALRRIAPHDSPEYQLFNASQTQEFVKWIEEEEETSDDDEENSSTSSNN